MIHVNTEPRFDTTLLVLHGSVQLHVSNMGDAISLALVDPAAEIATKEWKHSPEDEWEPCQGDVWVNGMVVRLDSQLRIKWTDGTFRDYKIQQASETKVSQGTGIADFPFRW